MYKAAKFVLAAGVALVSVSPASAAVTICLGGGCAGGVPDSAVEFVHQGRELDAGCIGVGERVAPGGLVLGHVGGTCLGERGELAAVGLPQGDEALIDER